jgi:hypothetical protein
MTMAYQDESVSEGIDRLPDRVNEGYFNMALQNRRTMEGRGHRLVGAVGDDGSVVRSPSVHAGPWGLS